MSFKASDQTFRDGVNKEVSNKHTLFILLLVLNETTGREEGRRGENVGCGCK